MNECWAQPQTIVSGGASPSSCRSRAGPRRDLYCRRSLVYVASHRALLRQTRRRRFARLVRLLVVPLRGGVVEHAGLVEARRQPHEHRVGEVTLVTRRQPPAVLPTPLAGAPCPLAVGPLAIVVGSGRDDLNFDRRRTAFDDHRLHGAVRGVWTAGHQRHRSRAGERPKPCRKCAAADGKCASSSRANAVTSWATDGDHTSPP